MAHVMMTTGRKNWIALAAALLVCGAAMAKDADPGYLQPSPMYDPAAFLPPPPAPGSPRALAELAELKQFQASRTKEQYAAAASDNDNENGTIFAVVLGPAWDL